MKLSSIVAADNTRQSASRKLVIYLSSKHQTISIHNTDSTSITPEQFYQDGCFNVVWSLINTLIQANTIQLIRKTSERSTKMYLEEKNYTVENIYRPWQIYRSHFAEKIPNYWRDQQNSATSPSSGPLSTAIYTSYIMTASLPNCWLPQLVGLGHHTVHTMLECIQQTQLSIADLTFLEKVH